MSAIDPRTWAMLQPSEMKGPCTTCHSRSPLSESGAGSSWHVVGLFGGQASNQSTAARAGVLKCSQMGSHVQCSIMADTASSADVDGGSMCPSNLATNGSARPLSRHRHGLLLSFHRPRAPVHSTRAWRRFEKSTASPPRHSRRGRWRLRGPATTCASFGTGWCETTQTLAVTRVLHRQSKRSTARSRNTASARGEVGASVARLSLCNSPRLT